MIDVRLIVLVDASILQVLIMILVFVLFFGNPVLNSSHVDHHTNVLMQIIFVFIIVNVMIPQFVIHQQFIAIETILNSLLRTVEIEKRRNFEKLIRVQFNKWKQTATTVAGGNGRGDKLDQLNNPCGIFIDKNNNIFIADDLNHRIVEWKLNENQGRIVAGGNGRGNRIDQLYYPSNVIMDKQNQSLIIDDRANSRVIRWFLNQNQQEILIENIDCVGLTIDKYGFLYVFDYEKNEARRWKIGEEKGKEGKLVAGGNGKGNQPIVNSARFIFVDDEQSIYVSDYDDHRVMKWKKDANEGIIVAGGKGRGNNLSQLDGPHGLIVDNFGQIYVADCFNH
uniref:NHL repeat protein-like protein n=1 Tax=Adineta vaga TaxID=104782 RepID=B3G4D1_ADIVA|nr:NHL repeat protein-like protein [Adineta vaga]